MTPEQRAKIQALRRGEKYVEPPPRIREIPESIKQLTAQKNFKKLFDIKT
jgi:hypothetical protein